MWFSPLRNPHTALVVLSEKVNASSTLFSIGTEITFSCESGFKFINTPGKWVCEDTGQWRQDSIAPNCIEVLCPPTNSVSHGEAVSESLSPGSVIISR